MEERPYRQSKDLMDPRQYELLESLPPMAPIPMENPVDVLKGMEPTFQTLMAELIGVPGPDLLEGIPRTIVGIDGNKINIKIYSPMRRAPGTLPGLVYFHGGGMAITRISDYDTYYRILASYGMVVVAVDFRNSTEVPFPGGLHDCLSAVLWTADHAHDLRIDTNRLVVGGESGGGNLAAATCLLAAEKKISVIKGQFLNCPWLTPEKSPSRHRYCGYFIPPNSLEVMASVYVRHQSSPESNKTTEPSLSNNPLAWPLHMPTERLRGLPPAIILTNEFDPLVDEGEEYGVRLAHAGVRVVRMRSLGTFHVATIMNANVPDVVEGAAGMLIGWMNGLGKGKSKL